MTPTMRAALAELATATVITTEPALELRLRIALIQFDAEAQIPSADPVPPVAETTGDLFEERGRGV